MIDLFELSFSLSTFFFFHGDINKHQTKKKSLHSWYFMVFSFFNIFSLLRTSRNVDKLLWMFTKFRLSLLLLGVFATTYILLSDLRLQTFFFIEPTHLNLPICTGMVSINSKQIIFTAVWRTQNIKLKACIWTPLPHLPPLPLARYMSARDFHLFI